MSIVVVSPELSSNIKLIYSPHSIISTGPSPYYENLYQSIHAEVTLKLHDNTIHDGDNCIAYTDKNENYGGCIERELKSLMKSAFGCVPAWVYPFDGCQQGMQLIN